MNKKAALGRGLGALLQDNNTLIKDDVTSSNTSTPKAGSVSFISISQIETNPFQPRTAFEEEALNELATSIKELGIIQPLTLRNTGKDTYQLISGERRFRASQIAGLTEVPAFIRTANDQEMIEMALVENIQRENLDAIEIAFSYQKLIEECNLTQEEMSGRVGKKRSTITNYLRLLKLPAEIQLAIRSKEISMGHARALVTLNDPTLQLIIYNKIVHEELSVRQTEEVVKNKDIDISDEVLQKKTVSKKYLTPSQRKVEANLKDFFKNEVKFQQNIKGKGKITIPFSTDEELDRVLQLMGL